MAVINCFHCGDDCNKAVIKFNDKNFCCNGCKTVYEILSKNDLSSYYELEQSPGKIPEVLKGKFDYLATTTIVEKLLDFNDESTSVVTLYISYIHCSSCIWVLEHLNKLNAAVSNSIVNFPKKEVRITFNNKNTSLKEIVELLSSIGYEPTINLESSVKNTKKVDRSLLYKLGVAGFAFGNIMLLSFPEYFQTQGFWIEKYQSLFRTIIFVTILPVVFYAANEYFISAYKGLKHKILNIDVPITLGIIVLFFRSSYEILFDVGQGYFDSLAGFVFFLLLGKIFQQQTYSFLSFERDYKSYFPIAVTKINHELVEQSVSIYDVEKGDILLIRNQELIPVDGMLLSKNTEIDYSFVTGESLPVVKKNGDKIFAGGKQLTGVIEMEVLQTVSQSYLTQLWSNEVFLKNKVSTIKNLTDSISKQFTIIILIIAFVAGVFWYFKNVTMVANVVTAVLIVACPCALALSAPFALGNMLRIFGRQKMYLKNARVVEDLSHIDTIIFDKTGTITNSKTAVSYVGAELTKKEKKVLKTILRVSNHPLSRILYKELKDVDILETKKIQNFKEIVGKGLQAEVQGTMLKIGASSFVENKTFKNLGTQVFVSINNEVKGVFKFENSYRSGLIKLFATLKNNYELGVLTGDNDSEKENLSKLLPSNVKLIFNQKPQDKLDYIELLQKSGKNVLMIGDGLNDAGALVQSNVGLAISEDVNVFSPASDGIIAASKFTQLIKLLMLSKKTLKVIKISFVISLLYNLIGMYFAVTGQLSPIIAAILMPLSSITVVCFVTIATNIISRNFKT